jgi:hypothetical protein
MSRSTMALTMPLTVALGFILLVFGILNNFAATETASANSANDVFCVTPEGGGPYTNCDQVFANLQDAVDAADGGETIKVAAGTYSHVQDHSTPSGYPCDLCTTVSQVVYISETVTIRGGYSTVNQFVGPPDPVLNPTIIDSQNAGRGLFISGQVSVTVSGLQITNGSGTGQGGHPWNQSVGGGIYLWDSTVIISRTNVFGNEGPWMGGGIFNHSGKLTLAGSSVHSNLSNGVDNFGEIDIQDSAVVSNTSSLAFVGGGVGNEGTMTVGTSLISDNIGRGINNKGDLIISDSMISHNKVGVYDLGGGIDNRGNLTIHHSTVVANVAGGASGIANRKNGSSIVIYNSAVNDNVGSGIWNFSGCSLILNNSTISGNMPDVDGVGGGGIENGGTLILNNTTVSNNIRPWWDSGSGGIWNTGTATLQNSIVAGNHHSAEDCLGTFTSLGYNLIGVTNSCTIISGPGDLLDVDPEMFHLIGLPGFHPLMSGSPAIDAGNPTGCTDHQGQPLSTDQRGVARVGRCDIGSCEFDPNNNPLSSVFLPLTTSRN